MKKDKILHFENFNHANHVNYFEKKKIAKTSIFDVWLGSEYASEI